jgi:hypothetical protein
MTATHQPETKSPSRRALLAGALGGLGAWAASAIGRPNEVHATNGDPVLVGNDHYGTATTSIYWASGETIRGNTLAGVGVYGNASSGVGVHGNATSGVGVEGHSDDSFGVHGESSAGTGVYGNSDSGTGVWGVSDSSAGVAGTSNSNNGVEGISSSGVAVRGSSNSGFGVFGDSGSFVAVLGYSGATNHPGTVGQSAGNSTGVQGYSGTAALPAPRPKTGVYGYAAQDSGSVGVWGESPAGLGIYGKTTGPGFAGYFNGKVYMSQFVEMGEVVTPAAPGAHKARLFIRSSAGKVQLCVRFPTGAVKILATES